jgi:hypothetical protein
MANSPPSPNSIGSRSSCVSMTSVNSPCPSPRHANYGYASTSHAAQGATVDRVIVNAASMRNTQLVNRKHFYVSISCARYDTQVYTDDLQALRRAVPLEPRKAVALETVKPARPTTELQQKPTSMNIKT